MIQAARVICLTILLTAFSPHAEAEEFTEAIHAFLQQRVEVEKRDVGHRGRPCGRAWEQHYQLRKNG